MEGKIFFEQLPTLGSLLHCGFEALVFILLGSLILILGIGVCSLTYFVCKTIIEYFND